MGLRLDYENEIQFHFQLEIVPSRVEESQQIENAGSRNGKGAERPIIISAGGYPQKPKSREETHVCNRT
jgi:hypothetical protein